MKLEVIFLFELFVNIYVWKKRKQKIKKKTKQKNKNLNKQNQNYFIKGSVDLNIMTS